MATTEVLLVKPVAGLGGEGDQVKVRAGYARNFLLPRKIAVTLNASNKKHVDSLKKRRAEREQNELSAAQELGKKLEKTSLAFAVKTGEGGRMFGAITAQDVHEKLVAAGIELALAINQLYPKDFVLSKMSTLLGHEETLAAIGRGESLGQIKTRWAAGLAKFGERRKAALIYDQVVQMTFNQTPAKK